MFLQRRATVMGVLVMRGAAVRAARRPRRRRPPVALRIRPIRRGDAPALQAFVADVSAETRRLRFHGTVGTISDKLAGELSTVDHDGREALVAEVWRWFRWRLIGVSRYAGTSPADAELAIVVHDRWQRRGIGSALLTALAERARAAGFSVLIGEVLAENVAVPRLLDRVLGSLSVQRAGPVISVRCQIQPRPPAHRRPRAAPAGRRRRR